MTKNTWFKVKKSVWFKAKVFGWGWYPYTWQAWLITFLYLATTISSIFFLETLPIAMEQKVAILVPEVLILTLILVYISYKKGEKPQWRWGF